MIKICSFHPGIDDTTSYYRGAWPMMRLQRARPDIEVTFNPELTHASIARHDIMFFQRPTTPKHYDVLDTAREHGIPIWVDQDDDLFSVPEYNPHFALYDKNENKIAIEQSIRLADVVTTASDHLAKRFGQMFNRKVVAIPNAFDDRGPLLKRRQVRRRNHVISWRGTNTHGADLLEYKHTILRMQSKIEPQPSWLFFGANPWVLGGELKNVRSIPPMNIMPYMDLFQVEAPYMHIVPLAYNTFNLSKSNISWIEASYAGAAVVAPNWDEWCKPGIMHFRDIDYAADTEKLSATSWEYICDTLFLSRTNKQRSDIVDYLMAIEK